MMAVRVDNRIANFIVREEEWLGLEYTTGFFCVVCGGCDDVDCVGVAYTYIYIHHYILSTIHIVLPTEYIIHIITNYSSRVKSQESQDFGVRCFVFFCFRL